VFGSDLIDLVTAACGWSAFSYYLMNMHIPELCGIS
jgi:hypothetical protein